MTNSSRKLGLLTAISFQSWKDILKHKMKGLLRLSDLTGKEEDDHTIKVPQKKDNIRVFRVRVEGIWDRRQSVSEVNGDPKLRSV